MPMFWAHIPENINPVAFHLGPVSVHWYGIMYAVAFFTVYTLVLYRIKTEKINYSKEIVSDFMFWAILAILLGGRLGYVLFYNLDYFLQHPVNIISPLDYSEGFHYVGFSGMSYHGALLGFLVTLTVFCRKRRIDLWRFVDLFIPVIPLGYTFGRLGNFINGELYGRITTVPWGMYFPLDSLHQLRHPSQLYEAFFEGVFLFLILWSIRKKSPYNGFLCGAYLIGYGLIRFLIEFFREPDPQLGLVLGPFTLGQVFCALMVISGAFILVNRKKREELPMESNQKNSDLLNVNCRDHLANERTFLAWIRTNVAIIAFGFVIEKFSLFMKQMSIIAGKATVENGLSSSHGYSAIVGIILVAFGTLMSAFAFIKFKKTEKQIDQGRYQKSSLLELVVTAWVIVVGVFLVIYLVNSV